MVSAVDLLVLSQIPNIGPNRLRALVSHFESSSTISTALAKEIACVEGFSKKLASQVVHFFKHSSYDHARKYAERQLSKLNSCGGMLLTYWHQRYPEHLKTIYDPPPYLFMVGEWKKNDNYSVAIVGTRSPSPYGIDIAERFSIAMAAKGITVISGLARGIDTVVHSATLKNGGRTVAVIGSGINVVYPPENRDLLNRIKDQGAVLSEYEMGAKPDAGNFPRRNRIISGISLGTLVIETDVGGGAMITASTALDQNREVFAVPGNVGSKQSAGCHALIKSGRAKLVETLDDVLEELALKLKPVLKDSDPAMQRPLPPLSLFEKAIIEFIPATPVHIDIIADNTGLATADVLVNLLNLEFKGLVKQLPGKMFVRL